MRNPVGCTNCTEGPDSREAWKRVPEKARPTPWIASLVVATPYQGRGIGRTLMGVMESHAARLGFNRIYLYTWTAENFYSNMGWSTIDDAKPERFPQSVIMEKRLSHSG